MAARGQPQFFLWAQKLQNLKKEIIQILLSHFPRCAPRCASDFFKVLLKFKMAAMDKLHIFLWAQKLKGGGPRVVVSTAAFHARVRGSVPGLGGLKETKMFLPHPRVKVSIVGSLRDREVACSPPGIEFRILCLEDSVISIISPSSGGSPGPA